MVKFTSVITQNRPEAASDANDPSSAISTNTGSAMVGHSRTSGEDEDNISTVAENSTSTPPLFASAPDTCIYPIITIGSKFVSLDSSHPQRKRTKAGLFSTFSKIVADLPKMFKLQQGETKSSTFRKIVADFLKMYELQQDNAKSSKQFQLFVLSTITTTAFAGLNLAAWNFHFPSEIEAYFWKVSSIMILVLPIVFASLAFQIREGDSDGIKQEVLVSHVVLSLIGVIYGIVRTYVIVECFIGLRSEPAEVYCTFSWASYFPHV